MAVLVGLSTVLCFLFVARSSTAPPRKCVKEDYVQHLLPCDEKTLTRSAVYYLNTNCANGTYPPVPITGLPCYCTLGTGIAGQLRTRQQCALCQNGEFGSGGEVINNWRNWTNNGTKPPEESNMITYCEISRGFIKLCQPWKASADNYTLESGENSLTRCASSVLLMTRRFILRNSTVSFDYRVDSRNCRSSYYGCDGLAFFINNKKVLDYAGNQFHWITKMYNLTVGTHTLKWIYRKSCFSFGSSFTDKAFIRSITLVGTHEPNVRCTKCPPGYYSNRIGASSCTACSYFQYQSKEGQQQCDPCPQGTYAMIGASKCLPLPNCTDDDIIRAPGDISTCSCSQNMTCKTTVNPFYAEVKGFSSGPKILCKNNDSSKLTPQPIQCRCQPGLQIVKRDGKTYCEPCQQGSYSTDGIKCKLCEAGHAAFRGKHFYLWTNNTLREGFSAQCIGDCSVQGGWIPAGEDIRTERVLGNVRAVLQSPTVQVVSKLGFIMFDCSVTCNLTGVKPKSSPGEHLAQIKDCNLIFQVWSRGTLQDQMNCTVPKGRYPYGHEKKRDGRSMKHVLSLKKGNYSFRWVFHQQDETRTLSSAFQGKVSSISIQGTKDGAARNCTPCPAGHHSILGNTDCAICPNGTASTLGSEKCTPCEGNKFADKEGSETCLSCGSHTQVLPNKDGCSTNDCKFSPTVGVEYDINKLSREGGPMFEVLNYQKKQPTGRSSRTVIFPFKPSLRVNPCTLRHDNTSCLGPRDPATGTRPPLPVMACRSSWLADLNIGSVIGYRRKKDVRSGLFVDLLYGDKCYYSKTGKDRFRTVLDLRCDVNAGVGNPGPENNRSNFLHQCEYYLVWNSLYACPKCQGHEVSKIVGECVNGTRQITYVRSVPCWGTGDHDDKESTQEVCEMSGVKNSTVEVLRTQKGTDKVYKIIIGMAVVVIVVLLGVAVYFVYKHRSMKYRYFTALTQNKPMSRLAEDDENNFVQDDELGEQFVASSGALKT